MHALSPTHFAKLLRLLQSTAINCVAIDQSHDKGGNIDHSAQLVQLQLQQLQRFSTFTKRSGELIEFGIIMNEAFNMHRRRALTLFAFDKSHLFLIITH